MTNLEIIATDKESELQVNIYSNGAKRSLFIKHNKESSFYDIFMDDGRLIEDPAGCDGFRSMAVAVGYMVNCWILGAE